MSTLKKHADDSLASSTGATAAFPVPTPSVSPTFAPGKQGPKGVSPRQNYSRVNTGVVPPPDAGAADQKSMAPRGAEMLPKRASAGEENMSKMTGQPMLQDLVKAAMVEGASRVRVSEEARLQQEKTAEEKCADCGMEKHSGACKTKKASVGVLADDGGRTEKLAGALDFLAEMLLKEGASLAGPHNLTEHLQTGPPGVSEATASKPLPDHKGQGVHVVPMHPGEQKAMKSEHGGTQMENTQDHAPELKHQQIQRNYGGKHASVGAFIKAKLASDEHEKKETKGLEEVKKGLETAEKAHKSEPENKEGSAPPMDLVSYMTQQVEKQAEDAINPAQIAAGKAVPPETSEAGQPGGAPAGGAPEGKTSLVASADAARNYTKGDAKAPEKKELQKYYSEPALSGEHDTVLRVAFEHSGQAGTKFGSAPEGGAKPSQAAASSVKTAAARVLLSELAATIDLRNKGGTTGTAASPGTV